jgi:hypothetical protein
MRFFKIIHFLSLDVVLGAVSLHMMFYHAFLHVLPRWEYDVLLGISVYWVYGLDRQIDNLSSDTPDELHTFHGQNQRNLLSVLLLLACVNAYLLFRVDFEIVRLGMILLLILVGYWAAWAFGLFRRLWGSKEFFTALIYSAGVLLPTIIMGGFHVMWGMSLFLLAWLNLCLFTWIDSGGNKIFIQLLIWVAFAWLLMINFAGFQRDVGSLLFLIWGIHAGIYYFRPQMHMRPWAEWAFASPLIYILCNL